MSKNAGLSYPSIFNDVIGPVMRGPSSSHCAAALRIGRMARDLMDGCLKDVLVTYDQNGSLATTHESQGADMGLFGGLLGWDASDERLVVAARALEGAGIRVRIEISEYGAYHPNTYKLTLANSKEQHDMTAVSTGGGAIEIIQIDGAAVSMAGDCFETLIFLDSWDEGAHEHLSRHVDADEILLLRGPDTQFVECKSQERIPERIVSRLDSERGVRCVRTLSPVLPVLSRGDQDVPFITCEQMLTYNEGRCLDLWELAVHYEGARGSMSHGEVLERMTDIVRIMQESIHRGVEGTEHQDRILGYQSGSFRYQLAENRLLDAGVLNEMILAATAMMEMKSSMGVIVAAPTAGACGGLPGACVGAARAMGLSLDELARAMLAAGMIGVFIAAHATFAAEVGGCQAECGAGSGMAASALVTLAGGTTRQAIAAASMALQNTLGMICDPVANRVEVPCLGKNVMAAANALACANMALADFDAVIPLDEVIETMDRVGKSIPRELRCTGLGGLSVTRTSREIERRLSSSHST
jgi:L-serine dehydratase